MHRSLEGQAGNCFRFVSCGRARLVPICEVRSICENPLSLFPFWTGICSLFPLPIQPRLALSVMGCCSVVSASAASIGDMHVCSLQGSEACVCVCCQDCGSQHREVPLLCLGSFARIHNRSKVFRLEQTWRRTKGLESGEARSRLVGESMKEEADDESR